MLRSVLYPLYKQQEKESIDQKLVWQVLKNVRDCIDCFPGFHIDLELKATKDGSRLFADAAEPSGKEPAQVGALLSLPGGKAIYFKYEIPQHGIDRIKQKFKNKK